MFIYLFLFVSPISVFCEQQQQQQQQQQQPYLTLHAWYSAPNFTQFVDVGVAAGFNSVRVTADWGGMQRTNGKNSSGSSSSSHDESSSSGSSSRKEEQDEIDFSEVDERLEYVINVKRVRAIVLIWLRRPNSGDDEVLPRSEEMENSTGSFVQGNNVAEISFASSLALQKATQFVTAVVERYYTRYNSSILCFTTVFSGYAESEYWAGGIYDYSLNSVSSFRQWLPSRYVSITALNQAWGTAYTSFAQVVPPTDFSNEKGLVWYQYRHTQFALALSSFSQAVHSVALSDPLLRHAVQWGSTYDSATRVRATIAFTSLLSAGVNVVWVDDAPSYPHAYASDLMRSSVGSNRWIANEIDSPTVGTDDQYYAMAASCFTHGTNIISVANWDLASLIARQSLFKRISADFLAHPVPTNNTVASLTVSALAVFQQGDSTTFEAKHNLLSQDGQLWVNVTLIDDLSWKQSVIY